MGPKAEKAMAAQPPVFQSLIKFVVKEIEIVAKMKKNLMAWVLVLSMISGMVAVPVYAEEEEMPNATVTVTVEQMTDANENAYGEKTTTQTDWSDSKTETNPGTSGTEGNVTTTVNDSVTTTVTGSETAVDYNYNDIGNNQYVQSGNASGSEDTVITNTTTTTTVTKDDVYSDETETMTDESYSQQFKGDAEFSTPTKTDDDGWVQTGKSEGTFKAEEGSYNGGTASNSNLEVNEPETNINVELTMNQGENSETTVKTFIEIEDAMEMPKEGEQPDGSVVTYVKQNGVIIGYEKVLKTPNTVRTETPDTNKVQEGDTSDAVAVGDPVSTYVKPDGYTPGVTSIVNSDGKQIGTETVEEIKDEKTGEVIGYRITTVEEVSDTPVDTPNTEKPGQIEDAPEPVMPPKPVAPAPVTKDGLTTTVIVEDLIENGKHVGYITTTKVTNEQGDVVSWHSDSIYHTVHNYSSTVVEDPEREVKTKTTVKEILGTVITQQYESTTQGTLDVNNYQNVEQDIYQLVQTDNGKAYFLYKGKMYPVTAIVDANGNTEHGSVTMTSIQPDTSLMPGNKKVNTTTDLYNRPDSLVTSNDFGDYNFKWLGEYGLESAIRIQGPGSNGWVNTWQPHQFVLVDKEGNKHYVYCADFEVSPEHGHNYNMENVYDADYYDSDAAKQIQAIALNGFWGTESGVGSLDQVKQMLKKALDEGKLPSGVTDADINALTEGEALTATQAAIWTFGDSGTSGIHTDDPVGHYYTGNSYEQVDSESRARVNWLYDFLVTEPAPESDTTSPLLNADNFATTTTLTIKEQVKDEDGNVVADESGFKKYLTDLKFTLGITDKEKENLDGDLEVTVEQEGSVVEKVQLVFNNLVKNAQGLWEYTISNLQLFEGIDIKLKLQGEQKLGQGAYLYTSEVAKRRFPDTDEDRNEEIGSQTFVGLSSGTRQVNLETGLQFTVSDPESQIQHTKNTWSEVKTDTYSYTKTNHLEGYKNGTTESQTASMNTKVLGTTTKTDVRTETTDMHNAWGSEYYNAYQYVALNGDMPVRVLNNIPEEAIPLADAPQTGDEAVFVAILTVIAGISLAVMHIRGKKEEESV